MAVIISEEIRQLLADKDTWKVIATVDSEGRPHVTFKESIYVNPSGRLEYDEFIETSRTNRNMVYSIWFKKQVAITLTALDGRSFQIKGTPVKAVVAGRRFSEHYERVQEQFPDRDLSTVWEIEPEEILEETFETRRQEEEKAHPILGHLDRWLERRESGSQE